LKSLSKVLLALYLLILIWLVLFKFSFNLPLIFDFQTRSINLIPFAFINGRGNLGEIIYNCVAFVPFGLLLSVNFKRPSFWRKLAFVSVFSLAAEIAQFVFAIGATDITDLITNTFGGFLGLILYALGNKYIHTEKLDRFIVLAGTILLVLFILLRILFINVRFQSAH
jgi:glycopeptide antibiotics resistance protein